MRVLDTIQGAKILELDGGKVVFIADADIDCDGSGGNPDRDPFFQSDTSLHYKGKALNAYQVPYVVVPPVVAQRVAGMVLGCRAVVTNLLNGKWTVAVVGDIGPTRKIGELSCECASRIGLNPNPNHGGTSGFNIGYEISPGVGAAVDGILYDLQPYGKAAA